jgi:hypothetical protein
MNKKIYKNLLLPLIIIELYLSFTVILYIFGPWDWNTNNPILLYLMLIIFQFTLALGYIKTMKKKTKININKELIEEKRRRYSVSIFSLNFIKALIIINLIFVILNVIRTLNLSSFSLGDIWGQFLMGLTDPASQYRESKDITTKFGGSLLSYSNVLMAPLVWLSIPIALFRFKELNIVYKTIALITIFLEAVRWLGIGTNKGFIDLILIILTIFMIKRISPFKKDKQGIKIRRKRGKAWILIAFSIVCMGVYSFSQTVGDRVQNNWGNLSVTLGNTQLDYDSLLMLLTPNSLEPTLIYMGSYLTQGYYALSLSTSIHWIPMFGVGNSMFLMDNISNLLNIDLYQITYQTRLEKFGWDSLVNWHSFYVWLANDVSLIGVVFIMYILGCYFAGIVYNAAILGDNLAVTLLCLLVILFVYIPANNQVFSYPTTFMAFWVLTIIWLFKKKYRLTLK